jgi:MFS family permease
LAASGSSSRLALFATASLRSRAIGVHSFAGSAGTSVGVIAGGILTQAISQHWIFFANLPSGLAALLAVAVSRTDRLLACGERPAAALTGGYHLAFGIGAGLGAVAVAVAVATSVLRPGAAPRPEPEPGIADGTCELVT